MTDPNAPSDLPNPARPQASGIDSPAKPMNDRAGRERPHHESGTPGQPEPAIGDDSALPDEGVDLAGPTVRGDR